MRIKHFAGYGCVNAKKISKNVNDNIVNLHIQVWGNHEWGIRRDDRYDFVNWLGKRFDKELTDYRQITDLKAIYDFERRNGEDVCNYYVTYTI